MWQELRNELHPKGLEVVTVALDTGGADAARQFIEAAKPEHPSLIDAAHVLGRLLGIVNVPQAVWIDETGMIVRPPEVASPRDRDRDASSTRREPRDDLPDLFKRMIVQVNKIRVPRGYTDAIRDWVENGSESRFALTPDQVVDRSRPRPPEVAQAAAAFELAQHLHRDGKPDAAIRWFREAHRLQPENWTYKRQAWSFADPFQGPNDVYDSSWVEEVEKIGGENYYEPIPELESS